MADQTFFLYDPLQLKEFGYSFYTSEGYSVRYQESKKLLWTSKYVPYGPICKTIEDFEKFLKDFCSEKGKVHIDLPLIVDSESAKTVSSLFRQYGFEKTDYIQDEETILIRKEDFKINSKIRNKVKKGLQSYDVIIKSHLDLNELNRIYEIYKNSSERIGFVPKSFEVFNVLNQNAVYSLAVNKETGLIEGFVTLIPFTLNQSGQNYHLGEIVFTATTEEARNQRIGYALHNNLLENLFENDFVDIIDFKGVSRTKERDYVEFKTSFGGQFVDYGGSFVKKRYF